MEDIFHLEDSRSVQQKCQGTTRPRNHWGRLFGQSLLIDNRFEPIANPHLWDSGPKARSVRRCSFPLHALAVWIISSDKFCNLTPICKMNDDCVILLEKVLAENARLRETIEARDVEHRRALQEINAKLDKENTSDAVMSQAKSGRKTARKVQISHECRVSDKCFLLLSFLTPLLPKNGTYIYIY